MKKRLLLLMAFGVSFAPPVFAAGSDAGGRVGENKISQMSYLGSAKCDQMGAKDLSHEAEAAESEIRKVRSAGGIAR